MSWQDVESVMDFWYREGAARAWGDVAELEQGLEDLATNTHIFETPEDRVIQGELRQDLQDQLTFAADELRAQLRLAAADRQASISMRM